MMTSNSTRRGASAPRLSLALLDIERDRRLRAVHMLQLNDAASQPERFWVRIAGGIGVLLTIASILGLWAWAVCC